MTTSHPLHQEGLQLARSYLKNEREMVRVLQEMQKIDLFRKLGFSGPYRYVEKSWGLGEEHAKLIVGVANLCAKVP